jgi:hypothetical protein
VISYIVFYSKIITQLFTNYGPQPEGCSAPPVYWSCGHSRLLTGQKTLLSDNLHINITQTVPYNGNDLCCYANIPGISITVTFPHPDCIWIYGNKDDDDDDDKGLIFMHQSSVLEARVHLKLKA